MTKAKKFDIGIVNRFSWHKQHGDFAEKYFLKNYFKGIGLSFRKIRKDKIGKKPDGYVLSKLNKKIALVEIKLIKYQEKQNHQFHRNNIDKTIMKAIKKAKKQLSTTNDFLPKIIYLILDDSFSGLESAMSAIFGKWIITDRDGKTIYSGYSGLCNKFREDNKLRDNLITAVICYKQTLNSHEIYIIKNSDSIKLPKDLIDKNHLAELWDYNGKRLKRTYFTENKLGSI